MQQYGNSPPAISKTAHDATVAATRLAQASEIVVLTQMLADALEYRNISFIINRLVTLGGYISLSSSPERLRNAQLKNEE